MTDARDAYHAGSDFQFEHEEIALGAPTSYSLTHDPKHLAFVLARYKFCAKMLHGKRRVMEVGSGDGFGLPLIAQVAEQVYCLDWDARHVESIRRRLGKHLPNVTAIHRDLNEEPAGVEVDAAFWVDVLEHLDPATEGRVLEHIIAALPRDGVLITGTPNQTAEQYSSACSRVQHINLKTLESLRALMLRYFDNVFMFGMNDEVLHTGYGPMSHYLWSVASGVRAGVRTRAT